ncbi:VgrG-related protein [Nitriliruptor alkaliphilus]|uniref:VgrG-related protein n=1 Tax=Nitriliruptor alkaliphilus TaxID=427918 RepID=UPI000696B3C6|nr:VgrG-related protein [Nitriliruptor alkaliphilus]
MKTSIRTQTPTVKLDGEDLRSEVASRLVWLRVELSVQRAGVATLRFDDPWFAILDADTFQVGTALQVSFHTDANALTSVFTGRITTVGARQDEASSTPVLEVRAHDASHRLIASSRFTAHLEKTPATIVTEIAQRHGLESDVVGGDTVVSYLLQSGTDHHFVSELASMLGYEWFTTGDTLHFRPRPTSADGPTLEYSDGLQSFSARYSGTATPASVAVHSWDPAQQKGVEGTAGAVTEAPDPMDLGSDALLVTEQHDRARGEFGRPLTVASTTVRDGPEADALAGAIARRLVGAGLEVEGTANGNPAVRAGGTVRIEEVGKKLSGVYYVTEVVHEFAEGQQVTTRFASTGHRVEAGPGSHALPGALDGWASGGLLIGVVTNNQDPEQLGRVKVRFPSLGDDTESEWARVVTPGAGKERGLDLRPEVDDEVVVGFERGDPRAPFVLGGMFNGKAAPFDDAVVADGKVERRVLASRVGHAITLSDGSDEADRHVEIKLADGKTKVLIGEDGISIEAAKGTPLALKTGGASLTLTDDEKLVIKAKEVTVTSDGDLTMKAQKAASIKASTGAKIDGGTAFEAKGVQAKLEGSAMTQIKGGMVKLN